MKDGDAETKKLIEWLGTGSVNLFGRPFSGKDTQAKMLSELFNAPIIGGGDIIRNSGNKKMNDHINAGHLTPQDEYLALVLPYLERKEYDGKPLILSSIGRWHGEEKIIFEATQKSNHPMQAVIYLDIPEDAVIHRWQAAKQLGDRGDRNDDNQDSVKTRLSEFSHKTLPVLEFYKQLGLLLHIDGTQTREDVTKSVLAALMHKATVIL